VDLPDEDHHHFVEEADLEEILDLHQEEEEEDLSNEEHLLPDVVLHISDVEEGAEVVVQEDVLILEVQADPQLEKDLIPPLEHLDLGVLQRREDVLPHIVEVDLRVVVVQDRNPNKVLNIFHKCCEFSHSRGPSSILKCNTQGCW